MFPPTLPVGALCTSFSPVYCHVDDRSPVITCTRLEKGWVTVQSFTQQLPTLIGVLLGALATYAATAASERARWRRAQSVRWDDKRLSAYAEYALALKKVISIAVRLAAHRGIHPDVDVLPPDEGMPALAAAEAERTIKWEGVLLLGSEQVVIAGRKWHESVFRLQRIASGVPTDVTWADAVEATSQARRDFYEAARRDMGITISVSPETFEWQLSKLVQPSAGVVSPLQKMNQNPPH